MLYILLWRRVYCVVCAKRIHTHTYIVKKVKIKYLEYERREHSNLRIRAQTHVKNEKHRNGTDENKNKKRRRNNHHCRRRQCRGRHGRQHIAMFDDFSLRHLARPPCPWFLAIPIHIDPISTNGKWSLTGNVFACVCVCVCVENNVHQMNGRATDRPTESTDRADRADYNENEIKRKNAEGKICSK